MILSQDNGDQTISAAFKTTSKSSGHAMDHELIEIKPVGYAAGSDYRRVQIELRYRKNSSGGAKQVSQLMILNADDAEKLAKQLIAAVRSAEMWGRRADKDQAENTRKVQS